MNSLCTTIEILKSSRVLSEEEMISAMRVIMSGQIDEEEMIQFLTLLRDRGEVYSEIVGAARVMREYGVKISLDREHLVDTCGTGGDSKGTFNLSTAAAFVVAGAGVRVAKHGNRAVSSSSGSADVLEALGVRIDLEPIQARRCLAEAGMTFFFAPRYHPAMKNVASARKKIGTKTLFNLLGPLTNPAQPTCQVIGVYDAGKMHLMAQVLKALGSERVFLVHGSDGLDEFTLTGPSYVVELNKDKITDWEFDPVSLGLQTCSLMALQGKDASYNANLLKNILEGAEGSVKEAVILNAAAALVVSRRVDSFEKGISLARNSIEEGRALKVLEDLVRVSNR